LRENKKEKEKYKYYFNIYYGMSTRIKEVDGKEIYLSEVNGWSDPPLHVIFLTGIGTFILIFVLCTNAFKNLSMVSLWISSILGLLISLAAAAMVCIPFEHPIKVYEVKCKDINYSIRIKKTTPEADQIAICNAAQALEIKAKEIARKKRGLEAIAARCK
jgi:hypothetical protein